MSKKQQSTQLSTQAPQEFVAPEAVTEGVQEVSQEQEVAQISTADDQAVQATAQDSAEQVQQDSTAAQDSPKAQAAEPEVKLPKSGTVQETRVQAPSYTGRVFFGDDDLDARIADLSTASQNYFIALANYAKAMAPGVPVDVDAGARHQAALYRTLLGIINGTGDDFKKAFTVLLRAFNTYKDGVFSEKYTSRFPEYINLSKVDRRAFLLILNLLWLARDPKTRSVLSRQVDFRKTLEHGLTESGRAKVLDYFNQ